jgi:cation-transporting ATPase E
MVLVSLTFAAAAVRMSRRGVLAQQLNAIESLASVDTICVDKTGTLTDAAIRVVEFIPAAGKTETTLRGALGALAANSSARNLTLQAIADACPGEEREVLGEVPFASRRRWSAVQFADGTSYLGAPGRVPAGSLASVAEELQNQGRRVLVLARGEKPLPVDPGDLPGGGLEPWGLVVLAEQLRPDVTHTIGFLREQGVEIKVLSGDSPRTVAAIARDVGIPVGGVSEGQSIPEDPEARRRFAAEATVVGRISPEGKQAIVEALSGQDRYVAMVGDGVNDVPALKSSRLAIAQGSGTQMARSVSDLVLVNGDFASVPALVAEGRRALRNLQRVTKLYVTKPAFAAFLILTIGTSSAAYPLLPRHLSLAASLTARYQLRMTLDRRPAGQTTRRPSSQPETIRTTETGKPRLAHARPHPERRSFLSAGLVREADAIEHPCGSRRRARTPALSHGAMGRCRRPPSAVRVCDT